MFKKKKCNKCGNKVNSEYDFCPYCGNFLGDKLDEEDYGILGKNDFVGSEFKIPSGFNLLFNSLLKNLNNQFSNLDNSENLSHKNIKKAGFTINIFTKEGMPPQINISSIGKNRPIIKEVKKEKKKEEFSKVFSNEKLKKFAGLVKEEPKTNLRRFADSVIYEIFLPGISSIEDISIIKLKDSIEIKALGDKIGYSKIIPIGLPIKNYNLEKEILTLELDSN